MRVDVAMGSASRAENAPAHGCWLATRAGQRAQSRAWGERGGPATLPLTKSSCCLLFRTPGWTHELGARLTISGAGVGSGMGEERVTGSRAARAANIVMGYMSSSYRVSANDEQTLDGNNEAQTKEKPTAFYIMPRPTGASSDMVTHKLDHEPSLSSSMFDGLGLSPRIKARGGASQLDEIATPSQHQVGCDSGLECPAKARPIVASCGGLLTVPTLWSGA